RPLQPKSPYGAGKAAFELYLDVYRQNFGLSYTVLRYANVYGPRQDPFGEAGVVAIFTSRLLRGEPVTLFARKNPGDDGCVRDYVYVGDVVAANLLAAEAELDGAFNVGTGVGTTTRQVLAAIEAALGKSAEIMPAPPRPGDLERSVVDASALRRAGWRPAVSFDEGIRRTVAWFQDRLCAGARAGGSEKSRGRAPTLLLAAFRQRASARRWRAEAISMRPRAVRPRSRCRTMNQTALTMSDSSSMPVTRGRMGAKRAMLRRPSCSTPGSRRRAMSASTAMRMPNDVWVSQMRSFIIQLTQPPVTPNTTMIERKNPSKNCR